MTVHVAPVNPTRRPAAAVLLAFDRLLTAGALYPLGHARFSAAVEDFRAAVETLGERAVVFDGDGDPLCVAGSAMDASCRGAERLQDVMDRLGLARITIDLAAPDDGLHRLAEGLLRQRREADEDGHLRDADFADLPPSLAVVPRSFRRSWSDGIDPALIPLLESVLTALDAACPDTATAGEARRSAERLFAAVLGPDHAESPERAGFIALLAADPGLLGRALRELLDEHGRLTVLDDLLDDTHEALASAGAQQALGLLIGAMAGPDQAKEHEAAAPELRRVDDDAAFRIPLVQMQDTFDGLAAEAAGVPAPSAGDPAEEITVNLALLALGPQPVGAQAALAGLERAARRCRSAADRDHLRAIAARLLEGADQDLVDQVLPRLASPFRARGIEDSALLWQALASGGPGCGALVWPHAALDLLRSDPDRDLHGYALLQELVAGCDDAGFDREAPRLAHLPGFSPSGWNRVLFQRPRPALGGLLAALLSTPAGPTCGEWIVEGWRRQGADTAGGLAARIIDRYHAGMRDLVRAVLAHGRQEGDGAPPRPLLEAARLTLEALEPDRREQDWVATALLVLGRWHAAPSRRLFERVVSERRLLMVPAWPAECRAAARDGLRRAEGGRRDGR